MVTGSPCQAKTSIDCFNRVDMVGMAVSPEALVRQRLQLIESQTPEMATRKDSTDFILP
jgi:hypothetical protein